MEGDYNLWADLLDTYQSLSDWIKALWLVIPPAFVLGLVALLRLPARETVRQEPEGPVYSVHRGPAGTLVLHRPADEVTDRSISPSPRRGDVSGEAAPSSARHPRA